MANKDLEKIKKEHEAFLNAFQTQKNDIVKEYAVKYTKIDKKVQASTKELDVLEASLKKIQNQIDTIKSSIPRNMRRSETILTDAQTKSNKIIESANKECCEIKKNVDILRTDALEMQDKYSKMIAQAKAKLISSRDMESKAKLLLSEVEGNNDASRKGLAKVNELKSENTLRALKLDSDVARCTAFETSLELREKDIKTKEKSVDALLKEAKLARSEVKKDRDILDEAIKLNNDVVKMENKEIEKKKAYNLEISEGFDDRQFDLDAQYEYLKNQKVSVESKLKKYEHLLKGSR